MVVTAKKIRFTPDQQLPQCFSLPFNCMTYILKNPISTTGLRKLHKTCKYFYAKFPIYVFPGICYWKNKFYKCKSERFSTQKHYAIIDIKNDKTLWWFNKNLNLCQPIGNLANKIFRCTICYLNISKIKILMEEFEILTSENTIEDFCLHGDIVDGSGKHVSIDIILSKLPNLSKIRCYNSTEKYSNETLKKLNLLEFNNEFTEVDFYLNLVEMPYCDPCLFVTFLKKNVAINSFIRIFVEGPDAEDFATEFKRNSKKWPSPYYNRQPDITIIEILLNDGVPIFLRTF